jgi:prophage DNA circulation protein
LRIFFSGENYDLDSDQFETALSENGVGRLEHPIYGTVNVVPFGDITRRDDLKTQANQSIFELTFFETIGLVYPTSQTDPAQEVIAAINEFNVAASEIFEEVIDIDTSIEEVTLQNTYENLLGQVSEFLEPIAEEQENVARQFQDIVDSVNNGIDILIGDPLTLAFQTNQLIQAPARALANIQARLEAYANLANSIIGGGNNIATPGNDSRNSNDFHTEDLYVANFVIGMVLSSVNNQFFSKSDALTAADFVLTQLDNVVEWRDANFESLEQIDTGESYQKLQEAVALTAGFLVEISFSLKQERRIILDRARTMIDLTAELYGAIDTELDFFISSNDLTGSEILELPKGREIVYYI